MNIIETLEAFVRSNERSASYVRHHGLGEKKAVHHDSLAEGFREALDLLKADPLHAAAPDLLAACRVFVSACTIWKDRPDDITLKQAQEMAEKAIEKATK